MAMRFIRGFILAATILFPLLVRAQENVPVNLAPIANRDFRDDVAGDGKGGWSDQGPANDWRGFDVSRREYNGMEFIIADPAKNGGKAIMTFDSPHCKTGLKQAGVELPSSIPKTKFLYLLHTSCWNHARRGTRIGTIEIMFTDGSGIVKEVKAGIDVSDWWKPSSGDNSLVVLRQINNNSEVGLFLSKFPLDPSREVKVKSLKFTTAGQAVWIVAGATLSNRDLDVAGRRIVYQPNREWQTIDLSDIRVKEGSALDLTALNEAGPSGKHGRVVIGSDGGLAFSDSPDRPRRFLGYTGFFWTKIDELCADRERLAEYARLVRRQGYNLVRPLVLDHYLMLGATADCRIVPERLDHIDRLFAELKKNGVYIYLTLGAYRLGFVESPWKSNDYRTRMYIGEEKIRANWKSMAEQLLNHVNPYTGLAWKDDPAIACVEFYNEQEWGMCNLDASLLPETRRQFVAQWRQWLLRKHKTPQGVADALAEPELAGAGGLAKLELPKSIDISGVKAQELGWFFRDLARAQMAWCENIVRRAGYRGLISQFNCSKMALDSAVRWETSPVVSMNVYYAHPTAHNHPGSKTEQASSIEQMADYWRSANATRLAGRPLIVTEYNHSFWNPYQHEAGPLFGAYSAFQHFSALVAHEDAVQLKQEHPLTDFGIAQSPVGRANQFMAACLFQRGDVAAARHQVELRISNRFLDEDGNRAVNADQTKVSLLTGFCLTFPGLPVSPGLKPIRQPFALTLTPEPGSTVWGVLNAATAVEDTPGSTPYLKKAVAQLKTRGILPPDNISNPDRDIFQSDTGEITLKAREKLLKVVTPRSEAVSLQASKAERLKVLTVNRSSIAAAVAVLSVDGQPLSQSRRIVLIFSTDAVNRGMELSEDRITLYQLGTKEILLRCGQLEATLEHAGADRMNLYALAVNGERREKLELGHTNGKLIIRIDTAKLKHGPTPFFELVAE